MRVWQRGSHRFVRLVAAATFIVALASRISSTKMKLPDDEARSSSSKVAATSNDDVNLMLACGLCKSRPAAHKFDLQLPCPKQPRSVSVLGRSPSASATEIVIESRGGVDIVAVSIKPFHYHAHPVRLDHGDRRLGGDKFSFSHDVDDVIGEAGLAAGPEGRESGAFHSRRQRKGCG